jgi:hypothetical protein
MKHLSILILAVILSSCASSNFSSEKIIDSNKTYRKFFVVSVFDYMDYREFNEEFYNSSIKENLNNFSANAVRNLMKKKVVKNFNNNRIRLNFSDDYFTTNKNVSYEEFIKTVKKSDSEAILFINQAYFNYKTVITSDCDGHVSSEERPEGTFFTYLIDTQTMETIWAGRFDSSGTSLDGKYSLYNNMCRKLHNKLIKERLLPKPMATR